MSSMKTKQERDEARRIWYSSDVACLLAEIARLETAHHLVCDSLERIQDEQVAPLQTENCELAAEVARLRGEMVALTRQRDGAESTCAKYADEIDRLRECVRVRDARHHAMFGASQCIWCHAPKDDGCTPCCPTITHPLEAPDVN